MREDIERKTKKLDSKAIEKGGEGFQDMQRVQNQILQIQAEREKNLAEQRAISGADAANNQTLAQAAEAMAIMSQDQQVGSNTQAVLGRYGYPQTQRSVSKKSSKQVLPGGNIVVNNNTVNNVTTNNGGYGGPIQGRPLQFKSPQDNSTGKFRAWLSNAFARQNERAAVRDREYRKREWSLARASNRMAKKLESISKSVGESLNPERVGTTLSSQLKALLFLFGTTFLIKNWGNIMEKLASIEKFFTGGKKGWKESGLKETLVKLFGGNDGDSVGTAFKHFFWNDQKNGVFDMLADYIRNFFEIRAEAVKQIKIPSIDPNNLQQTISGFVSYLGDIFKVFLGGTEALKGTVGNQILRESVKGETDFGYRSKIGHKVEETESWNTSLGDKVLTKKDFSGNTAVHLLPGSIDSSGQLTNKASATISQSNSLGYSITNANKNGIFDVAKVAAGLSRLSNSLDKSPDNSIPVGLDFLKKFLTNDQIESLTKSNDISKKKFMYVKREKTPDEYAREGGGDLISSYVMESIADEALNTIAGDGYGVVKNTAKAVGKNSWYILGDTMGRAGVALNKKINKAVANKYTWDLVPYDENTELEAERDKNGKIIPIEFPTINQNVLRTIRSNIGNGTEYELSDKTFLKEVQSFLRNKYKGKELPKVYDPETGKQGSNFDIDIDEKFKSISELEKIEESKSKKLSEKYETSPLKKSIDWQKEAIGGAIKGIGSSFSAITDWGSGMFNSIKDVGADFRDSVMGITVTDVSDFSGVKRGNRNEGKTFITKEEARSRVVRAMDYLMKTHGFTPEQAAGMVGNFLRESGMNHDIYNFGGGEDYGLAQWLSKSRKDNFRKWFNKDLDGSSFEEQLQFVSKELENTHKTGLNAIRNSQTVDDAAAATLGYYEFSAGPEAAMAALDKANAKWVSNAGWKSMDAGIKYGRLALDIWKKAKGGSEPSLNTNNENSPKIFLPDEPAKLDTEKLANYSNNWTSGNSFGLTASYKPSSPSLTPTSVTPIAPTSITPVKPDKPSNPMDSSSSMDKLIANSERQIQVTEALAATMTEVGVLIANNSRGTTVVNNNNVNNTSVTPGFNNNNVKE